MTAFQAVRFGTELVKVVVELLTAQVRMAFRSGTVRRGTERSGKP